MRPILVPNANCLPDPKMFYNTQAADVSGYTPVKRVFLDVFIANDPNADPYTAVMSGNPVVNANGLYGLDMYNELYTAAGGDGFPRVFPIFAIDLSTNVFYLLLQSGENAQWVARGIITSPATLDNALDTVKPLFSHSTPHPSLR